MSEDEVKQIVDNILFCTKEVLTSEEAARYMGISKNFLYQLTARKQIPYYKPMGRRYYFNRAELEAFLQRNKVGNDC